MYKEDRKDISKDNSPTNIIDICRNTIRNISSEKKLQIKGSMFSIDKSLPTTNKLNFDYKNLKDINTSSDLKLQVYNNQNNDTKQSLLYDRNKDLYNENEALQKELFNLKKALELEREKVYKLIKKDKILSI